jgi:ankyrin repeat protein
MGRKTRNKRRNAAEKCAELFAAVRGGDVARVEKLLKSGADVNVVNEELETPLHLAAGGGHLGLVELLIKHGADVNAQDSEGRTPLCIATANNDDVVVELLLKHGATPCATKERR